MRCETSNTERYGVWLNPAAKNHEIVYNLNTSKTEIQKIMK